VYAHFELFSYVIHTRENEQGWIPRKLIGCVRIRTPLRVAGHLPAIGRASNIVNEVLRTLKPKMRLGTMICAQQDAVAGKIENGGAKF